MFKLGQEPAQAPANFTFVELTAYNACGPLGPLILSHHVSSCHIIRHPFFIHSSNGSNSTKLKQLQFLPSAIPHLCGLIC